MSIYEEILKAFPDAGNNPALSNEQICQEHNPMERQEQLDLIEIIPCYMLFCLRNPDHNSLIADYTVNALAEYGRCKDLDNEYLNFKFKCGKNQILAVASFLKWAKGAPVYADEEQIDRSLRNWR